MHRRTGVVAVAATMMAVAVIGPVPLGAAAEAAPLVTPDPADVTSEVVADGVVTQTVTLRPGVEVDGAPTVTPPDWASDLSIDLAGAQPDILTEPMAVDPFHLAAVTWAGEETLVAWVRIRTDGAWSGWYQLPEADEHAPEPDSDEAQGARQGTDPLLVAESDAVQVRITATDESGELPTDLRLDLVHAEQRPGDDDIEVEDPDTGGETNPHLPGDVEAMGTPQPTISSRAAWGADESLREEPPDYGVVDGGFVHHTVSANNYTQAQVPSMLRSIYAYHVNGRGWNDIGYNFLVDKFGRIWEGRWGGISKPVIGAHTLGYNDDAFAMSALGTYTSTAPTSATISAYQWLFAWKFTVHSVDPRYPVSYDGDRFNAIAGHRDAGATECPGDALYARLPAIRASVISRMALEPSRDVNDDRQPDIMMTTPDGSLYYAPGWPGTYRAAVKLGGGWNSMRLIVAAGDFDGARYDDLLAIRRSDGALVFYAGVGGTSHRPGSVMGFGWNTMDVIAPGDWNEDGARDLVTRRSSDGSLWFYPGRSGGGLGARTFIASNWNQNDVVISAGDWNRDTHLDLIARNRYSGNLFLVPGRGNGTFGAGQKMSSGWAGHAFIGAGDIDLDGKPDLTVRRPDGSLWRYPGNGIGSHGTPVRLGPGWNVYNRLI
jgi:hypothetical protein